MKITLKQISLTICLSLILFGCKKEKVKSNWIDYQMQSEADIPFLVKNYGIKSVTDSNFFAKEVFGEPFKLNMYRVDVYTYEYNKEEIVNRHKKNNYHLSSGEFVNFRMSEYKWDSQGKAKEVNEYDSEGNLTSKTTYKYNENNNMTEMNSYTSESNTTMKLTHKYDRDGNVIEINTYQDSTKQKLLIQYDDEGRFIEDKYFDSNDNMQSKNTFVYDIEGNIIAKHEYDSNNKLVDVIKFDNNGNEIEKNAGSIQEGDKWVYKYDEHDKKGNWHKKYQYHIQKGSTLPKLIHITIRVIDYN